MTTKEARGKGPNEFQPQFASEFRAELIGGAAELSYQPTGPEYGYHA